MPKSAKLNDSAETVLKDVRPNSEGRKLRGFLDRVKNLQAEIDKVTNAAKLKCEPFREDVKAVKKEAAEAGFSAKEFNTLVRKERLELKIENIDENLDDDQKERFEDMLAALETVAEIMGPLGKAALEAAQQAGAAQ